MTQAFVNGFVDNDRVTLLYRDEAGVLRGKSMPANYSSFHRVADFPEELLRAVRDDQRVTGLALEGDFVRLRWRDRWIRKAVVKALANPEPGAKFTVGVPNFEADVDPIRRLFSDQGLEIQKPRRLFFDLEVDSRKTFAQMLNGEARILSWAAHDEEGHHWSAVLEVDTDDAERAMLDELFQLAQGFDMLLAWNGEGFDFPVIEKRNRAVAGTQKDFRRWIWLDQMMVFERMNKNASESGDEKQSVGLENVAQALLGIGKDDFDATRTWEAWEAGGAERERMRLYNVHDAGLMVGIEGKTGYVALFQTICEVCRCFPNTRSLLPSLQVDGLMLRLGVEQGFRFPSRDYEDDGTEYEQFAGAMVMKDVPEGIQREVHVADFAAMYPSIIVTWNMSPETKRDIPVNGDIPEGCSRAPSTRQGFTTQQEGILPHAVVMCLQMRKQWSAKQAALTPGTPEWIDAGRKSMAYKVFANTFYGVISSRFSRFYDRVIGESITQNGVWLIKKTKEECEARGWKVVYADTDSVFVIGPSRAEFDAFTKWLNEAYYPRIVAETGATANLVKIAYEKQFKRLCFTSAKKYIGSYAHYKGKDADETSKPEVKGLEWKRGDWNRMARGFQREVIMAFHRGEEDPGFYERLVLEHKDAVLNRPLEIDDIVISKSVQKVIHTNDELRAKASKKLGKPAEQVTDREMAEATPEDGYAWLIKKDGTPGAQQPHILVAKLLKERGREMRPGLRIDYVVVDGFADTGMGCIPLEDYKGECDRNYLWEKLVYPATQRLLEAMFPGKEWKQHLRARLKKERKAKVERLTVQCPETTQLLLLPPSEAAPRTGPRAASLAPRLPARRVGPLVVHLPAGEEVARRLDALLRSSPGTRAVEVHLKLDDGNVAILAPQARVTVTPFFLVTLRNLGGITSAEAKHEATKSGDPGAQGS